MEYIRQVVVNNGYSNSNFDEIVNRQLNRYITNSNELSTSTDIIVNYEGIYTQSYKKDEKVIKDIVMHNCRATNPNTNLKLRIYYKNPKTSSLVIKNNLSASGSTMAMVDVIYKYACTTGDCAPLNVEYVGQTTCTLSRRLTGHLQSGAIQQHHVQMHGQKITRDTIVRDTRVIARCGNKRKLEVLEAVYIRELKPHINIQMNMIGRVPLFDSHLQLSPQRRHHSPPPRLATPPIHSSPPPRRSQRLAAR